jgi:hypothetical protein
MPRRPWEGKITDVLWTGHDLPDLIAVATLIEDNCHSGNSEQGRLNLR